MIRKANTADALTLTTIAFSSKRYWNYPEAYFENWAKELTITGEYIKKNLVYIFVKDSRIIAFYSIKHLHEPVAIGNEILEPGIWLDHMFVVPEYIGNGTGSALFKHCVSIMKENGWDTFKILSDPNAKDFYIKQGCRYLKEIPSSIEGRTTPLLDYRV